VEIKASFFIAILTRCLDHASISKILAFCMVTHYLFLKIFGLQFIYLSSYDAGKRGIF